jgi:hypothetical protein
MVEKLRTTRIEGLRGRIALPAPKKSSPTYRGAGICYRGDKKWCVGLVAVDDAESLEWIDGLTFDEALAIIEKHEKHFVYQDDEAVFGSGST